MDECNDAEEEQQNKAAGEEQIQNEVEKTNEEIEQQCQNVNNN